MLKKVCHISIILGLLLCITLSFAWMTELDSQSGRFLYLEYDKTLYSAANEMDAKLYVVKTETVNGEETEVLEDVTVRYEDAPDALVSTANFAPGDYRAFVLKLQNKTNAPMSVAVNLAKIAGDQLFLDYMNVGISGSTGFTEACPAPKIEEFPMAERYNGSGAVNFIKLLLLPPTADASAGDNIVEIRFYVRFSHTAVNELQNKTFTIGVINVLAA